MTEMRILSGFSAFAGFGLPYDLRETITIPASTREFGCHPRQTGDLSFLGARKEGKGRGEPVKPLQLVIELAEGGTRRRSMTADGGRCQDATAPEPARRG